MVRAVGAGRSLPVCSVDSTGASPAKAAPQDEVSFGSSRRVVSAKLGLSVLSQGGIRGV